MSSQPTSVRRSKLAIDCRRPRAPRPLACRRTRDALSAWKTSFYLLLGSWGERVGIAHMWGHPTESEVVQKKTVHTLFSIDPSNVYSRSCGRGSSALQSRNCAPSRGRPQGAPLRVARKRASALTPPRDPERSLARSAEEMSRARSEEAR